MKRREGFLNQYQSVKAKGIHNNHLQGDQSTLTCLSPTQKPRQHTLSLEHGRYIFALISAFEQQSRSTY